MKQKNKNLQYILILFAALFIGKCMPLPFPKGESSKTGEPQQSPQTTPSSLSTLLDSLELRLQQRDTTALFPLFTHAFDQLDSLQLTASPSMPWIKHSQMRLDSLWKVYENFTTSTGDSADISGVFQEINRVTDSLTQADTAAVTIPDVIDSSRSLRIPLILNRQVEQAIKYFTENQRGRRVFTVWLRRAGRYEKLIRSILREEGVPEELFYLAMIESGLNPHARSYARAVGIWQFIGSTGRAYGLRYSWWYDERRDPVKSTRAAARHLKDLYERFNDWYLALAGYNFSPRKIEYRLRRYKVSKYWELPRLPRQTRNYVPTFIAAAIIAKNPEKYGFQVTPDPPIEFDTVTVKETVDLNVVARCVGATFREIKQLNPELLRWCTPPERDEWVLKIPKGTREQFLEAYAKIPDKDKLTYVRHRIRYGETLSTIARRYGVSIAVIKRFNKIRGTRIRAGSSLIIPVPQNKKYYQLARQSYRQPRKYAVVQNVPGHKKVVYRVKTGDTLWDIAQQFGVTIRQLRRWNGLGYTRIIRPGQTLNIWLPEKTIAQQTAPPSSKSSQGTNSTTGEDGFIFHTVKPGDTLWDIAQQYGVSIREIKQWNGRRSNLIRPGDRLKIKRKTFGAEGTR